MKNMSDIIIDLTNKVDRIFAVLGLLLALVLIIIVIFRTSHSTAIKYIIPLIIVFVSCITYLYVSKTSSNNDGLSYLNNLRMNKSVIIILNIVFVVFLLYSIYSMVPMAESYKRPLSYFIVTSLMISVLAVESIFMNSKKHIYFGLLKITLLSLILVWTPQIIFPSLIGIDPLFHKLFVLDIIEGGYIPNDFSYSKLPVMHLLVSFILMITSLDYNIAIIISSGFLQINCLILIFLLGKTIYDEKVGLFASLMLSIGNSFLHMNMSVRPITFGLIILPLFIYLLLKEKNFNVSILILLISIALILTHAIASVTGLFLVFILWVASELYKKIEPCNYNIHATRNIVLFFMIFTLSWWMNASGHITFLGESIKWGFERDAWDVPIVAVRLLEKNALESVLSEFGFYVFCGFSIIGLLYMLSKKYRNKYSFSFALSGLALLLFIFASMVSGKSGIFYARWLPSIQIILAIPMAIGILSSLRYKNKVWTLTLLFAIVFILSFVMIISPAANTDNPIYSKNITYRQAFTSSEIQSANTIQKISGNRTIKSDFTYSVYLSSKKTIVPRADLTHILTSGDYTKLEGIIVIREEIRNNSFYVGSGVFKIQHDPIKKINNMIFNHFYDSGSVYAFQQSGGVGNNI